MCYMLFVSRIVMIVNVLELKNHHVLNKRMNPCYRLSLRLIMIGILVDRDSGLVPQHINKPPISPMYIYMRHNLYQWGLDTRGEQCSTDKKWGEGQLTTHEIRYSQREITSIVNFLIKA